MAVLPDFGVSLLTFLMAASFERVFLEKK